MKVYQAILKRRTIRLFQPKSIKKKILEKLINAARLAPSARNLQPLEYLVVDDPKLCDQIFENVYFGGKVEALRKKENRPVAYILVLVNKKIKESDFEHDVGLAVENIVLSAWEEGIGCCILGAIDRKKITQIFNLPSHYYLDLVVALGYPAEKPVLEEGKKEYWRDEKGILHVPKRSLKEILHWNKI
ncbi:nitroreductase family protein [Candidatus Parcubacteria bacterium]|nr:nitroreductase family protein [Candidatus Parcubacteria bacterium]